MSVMGLSLANPSARSPLFPPKHLNAVFSFHHFHIDVMLLDYLPIKSSTAEFCSEKEEGEDAAALRLRCSDVFSKTVFILSFFFLLPALIFFVFCLPDGRVF